MGGVTWRAMRREYVTMRKAAATTTTIAINGGLKSTGNFDGGGDGIVDLFTTEVGDGDGDGDGAQ